MAYEDYYSQFVTPENAPGLQPIRDWDARQRSMALFGGVTPNRTNVAAPVTMRSSAPARVAVPQGFDAMSLVTPTDGLGIQRIHELDAEYKRQAAEEAQRNLQSLIGRTAAAGVGVPMTGPVTGQTMINKNLPPVTYFAPVPNPQGAPAAPPAEIQAPAPEWQGPPAPPEGTSIGPGVAIPQQGSAVTATDLPALPEEAAAAAAPRRRFSIPVSDGMEPPSRRFSSTRPQFIYTNPVAAQQAAAAYRDQLSYEQAQDQGFRDFRARQEAEKAATERANLQAGAYRDQLRAAASEGALQRASNERITGMAEAARARALAQANIQEARNRYLVGKSAADQLNRDPNARVNRNFVTLDPATGQYVPAFPDPDAASGPPPAVAVPQ